MKFLAILIGKPIDPFSSASLGGSTEYALGWQEHVLHVWGREKPQILSRGDICQIASVDVARAKCTWWVFSVAETVTRSWGHCADSERPPLVLAEMPQEELSLMGRVLTVS